MTARSHQTSAISTDLLTILVSSGLIVCFLLTRLLADAAAHSAESTEAMQARLAQMRDQADAALARSQTGPAPWVKDGKPVPAWVLYPYSEDATTCAPEPTRPGKTQSWYNRMLFPTSLCPYCGRRVPTRRGSYIFLIIGFVGQIFFSARFFVQWIATEKAKDSVVPEAFWWLSIVGSLLLLVYSISIVAWPIILGQSPNVFIYSRNLYFIHKRKRAAADEEPPTPNATDE